MVSNTQVHTQNQYLSRFVTYTIETTRIDRVDSMYSKTKIVSETYEYKDIFIEQKPYKQLNFNSDS